MTDTTTNTLVEAYQALEVDASLAEIPASELRYEQCRIAYESPLTLRDFARAVSTEDNPVSKTTIGIQRKIWTADLVRVPGQARDTYWNAYKLAENRADEKAPKAEPKIDAISELTALEQGFQKHLEALVAFDVDHTIADLGASVGKALEAAGLYVQRWAQGEEVSGEVYGFIGSLNLDTE